MLEQSVLGNSIVTDEQLHQHVLCMYVITEYTQMYKTHLMLEDMRLAEHH